MIIQRKRQRKEIYFLQGQDEALIINIASAYSKVVDSEVVPYCASKFGLRGFTQALALELPKNVRTYVVNPGLTATRMTNFSGVAVEKVADIIVKTAEHEASFRQAQLLTGICPF